MHRHHSVLVLRGKRAKDAVFLHSKEGVTQGCPLSMVAYALLILPLIKQLKKEMPVANSMWFADDGSVANKFKDIASFFSRLCQLGPNYGYFPEESKSILVVKESATMDATNFCINIDLSFKVTNGCRYLGGYVGEKHLEKEWIDGKVENWVESVENLSPFASPAPQSTYAGMQRALQHEWTFIQRAVPYESTTFEPLESAIQSRFLPSLLGSKVGADLREWTSSPIK